MSSIWGFQSNLFLSPSQTEIALFQYPQDSIKSGHLSPLFKILYKCKPFAIFKRHNAKNQESKLQNAKKDPTSGHISTLTSHMKELSKEMFMEGRGIWSSQRKLQTLCRLTNFLTLGSFLHGIRP